MSNHNKFDHVFVDLSPSMFTLCVSLLAASSIGQKNANKGYFRIISFCSVNVHKLLYQ